MGAKSPQKGDSFRDWGQEVAEKLKNHFIPENEKWLTVTEASRLAGIKPMQVKWLKRQGVIVAKPHPTRQWFGQPVVTFAASQMEIIRQVRQERDRSEIGY
jgi:hypothetical protein